MDEQQRRDEWFEKKKGALYDHFTEQEQQLTEQFEQCAAHILQKQT